MVTTTRRGALDLLSSLLGNAGLQLVGVVTAVMAARIFDPSARGEIAAAVTWLLIMSAVADLGLSQSVPYYVARKVRAAGSTSIALVVAVSICLAPLFVFLPGIVGYRLSASALAYSVAGVPFCLIISYVGGVFQGESRHRLLTLVRLLGCMPYAIALVAAAVGRYSPDAVLWQALGLTVTVCLLLCLWSRRSSLLSERPTLQLAGLLTSYGLRTYPGNLAWMATQRIPMLLVGGLAGTASLGYYTVAQSYAVIPFAVASAFALMAPGRIGSCSGADSVKASRKLCRFGLLATWGVVVVLVPITNLTLVPVFGRAYEPSVGPAVLLVIGAGLFGQNFVLSASLRALDYPSVPSFAEAAGLVAVLISCPFFVQWFGWVGAAWATVVGAGIVSVLLLIFLRRCHNSRLLGLERSSA